MKYGLIAGNGRFPILALETARSLGHEVVVLAIKEEASPDLEPLAPKLHWISLGELSRLIDICHDEEIHQIMMCGQVKHTSIFSSIKPDWRLFKILAALPQKNTDGLIGAVVKVLAEEGIELVDSTTLLKPLISPLGVLTRRKPDKDEQINIQYGRRVAHALASFDIGQSVAVSDRACVALEAMEGTDAVLRRAASLVNGKPITLVKASSRRRHLLFDVPVLGLATMEVMRETGTTACSVDAGRTLLLDKNEMLARANEIGIAIVAEEAL